jgi:hypothetical protein
MAKLDIAEPSATILALRRLLVPAAHLPQRREAEDRVPRVAD